MTPKDVRARLKVAEDLLAEWVANYTEPRGVQRYNFTKRVMEFLEPGCDTFEEWNERRPRKVYEVSLGFDNWIPVPPDVLTTEGPYQELVCQTEGGKSTFTHGAWRLKEPA